MYIYGVYTVYIYGSGQPYTTHHTHTHHELSFVWVPQRDVTVQRSSSELLAVGGERHRQNIVVVRQSLHRPTPRENIPRPECESGRGGRV